jgi:hypothetical protein
MVRWAFVQRRWEKTEVLMVREPAHKPGRYPPLVPGRWIRDGRAAGRQYSRPT